MKRRLSLLAQLGIVVFSLITCTTLVLVLSERFGARIDMTGSREHRLSEESRQVVAKLDRPVTIAIAADLSSLTKSNAQRLRDVLDAITATSPRITGRLMDTASASGQAAYEQLLRQLALEDKPAIDTHLAALSEGCVEVDDVASKLGLAGTELGELRERIVSGLTSAPVGAVDKVKQSWDASAADLRFFIETLTTASKKARDVLSKPLEPLPVPAADEAQRLLREALSKVSSELPRVNDAADQAALSGLLSAEAKATARALGTRLASLRDRTARLAVALDRLGNLRVLRVASAIGRNRGCILIGGAKDVAEVAGANQGASQGANQGAGSGGVPSSGSSTPSSGPNITAVDIDELIGPPAAAQSDQPQVDRRFRMEELLIAGLNGFVSRPTPLVVFLHTDRGTLAPSYGPIKRLVDRLALMGIDAGEWRVVADPELPVPIATAIAAGRPVVFATVSPALIPGEQSSMIEAANRAGKLSSAIELLLSQGRNLLISVVPSTLPAGGAEDPLVRPLEALGIKVDSGRVLLEQTKTAQGRGILTSTVITDPLGPLGPGASGGTDGPAGGAGLIGRAISGLKTQMVWPVTMTLRPVEGVSTLPLISATVDPDRWAEAEWLRLRQYRGDPTGAPLPEPGGPKDLAAPGDGARAWVLACAAERASAGGGLGREGQAAGGPAGAVRNAGPQRVIVVGSQGWYVDAITDAASVVDGRAVFDFPGNSELFVSSVRWLTGQESLIRRSAQSQSVPVIAPMTPERQTALRLLVIAILPLGVLLLGAISRLIRR